MPINKHKNIANPIEMIQTSRYAPIILKIYIKLLSLQIILAIMEQMNKTGIKIRNILKVLQLSKVKTLLLIKQLEKSIRLKINGIAISIIFKHSSLSSFIVTLLLKNIYKSYKVFSLLNY